MSLNRTFYQHFGVILVFTMLFSCGKKIKNEGEKLVQPGVTPAAEEIQEALKLQSLQCASRMSCPEHVVKLTIITGGELRFCQGTFVDGNKIVTSASCLPSWIRFAGAMCESNIVFSFMKKRSLPSNFECSVVESVSSGLRRTQELWDNDIAVLKLKGTPRRRAALLTEDGIYDSKSLSRWSLKVEDLKTAIVEKDHCKKLLNSYANPFANNEDASFQLLSGCNSAENPLGASLFNSYGRFVGVQSSKVDNRLIRSLEKNGLLFEGVAKLSYVSNLACTDIRKNNYDLKPKGCFDLKTYYELDKRRSKLILAEEAHRENVERLERQVSSSKKYFQWNFKFVANKKLFSYELRVAKPKCFFGVNRWIREFRRRNSILSTGYLTLPRNNYTLKTKLNKFLRPVSIVKSLGQKTFKLKFNPYSTYVNRKTYVAFKVNQSDRQYKIRFENIRECN